MKAHFIANYEVYNDAGRPTVWGNSSFTIEGDFAATDVANHIMEGAAKEIGCDPKKVRIIGVFRL